MLRKRTRNTLLITFLLVVLLGLAVVLRMKAPPESARLLPESDAIVYLDLRPLRAADRTGQTGFDKYADLDPEYQHFLAETGFNFERDLDEVAIALHRMPDPSGPNGPIAYSIVLQGRFNRRKLGPWIASLASGHESYEGHDIYSIPVEGRTLRVTFLGYDMVATSNMPTPEQIHSMVDRYRSAALPSSGSSLLAERYGDVPLLSFAWGIGRLGLPFAVHAGDGKTPDQVQVMGVTLPVPADATIVASLRFEPNIAAALTHTPAVQLRVDEFTPDASTAQATAQSLGTLLDLYRGMQPVTMPDSRAAASMQNTLHSLRIVQRNNRVVLTGTVTMDLLRSTFSGAVTPSAAAPAASAGATPATTAPAGAK